MTKAKRVTHQRIDDPRAEPDGDDASQRTDTFIDRRASHTDSDHRGTEPADLAHARTRTELAQARAQMAAVQADCAHLRARTDSLLLERDAQQEALASMVGELGAVLDALERIELDLAEARADAKAVIGKLMAALGRPGATVSQQAPTMTLLRSDHPSAACPPAEMERPTARPEDLQRPTTIPDAMDVSELLRAVEHL